MHSCCCCCCCCCNNSPPLSSSSLCNFCAVASEVISTWFVVWRGERVGCKPPPLSSLSLSLPSCANFAAEKARRKFAKAMVARVPHVKRRRKGGGGTLFGGRGRIRRKLFPKNMSKKAQSKCFESTLHAFPLIFLEEERPHHKEKGATSFKKVFCCCCLLGQKPGLKIPKFASAIRVSDDKTFPE